jgi:hypothetical protein
MQRNLLRALLLAMAILLVGALPAMAQTDDGLSLADDGLSLTNDDGSVLIGLSNDVTLPAGAEADAIFVVNANALVEGTTKGLIAIDSDVTITGGDANVENVFAIGGSVSVENGATVDDITHIDSEVGVASTAVLTGEIIDAEVELVDALAAVAVALLVIGFFIMIGAGLATLMAALLVVAWGTSQVRRAAFNIGNDVLKTIVVGLLMMILPWLVIGLLAITIVGIPLAIGLAALWGIVAFLGYITVGLWIGERILRRSRTASRPYGAAFLGVLILMLLSWVPLVSALAVLFGTGAVTLAGWRVLRGGGAAPVPPGYGGPWDQSQQYAPPPQYAPPGYAPPPQYAPPPYAPPPPEPQPGGYPPQPGQYPPQGDPPQPGQYPPQGDPPASWPQG